MNRNGFLACGAAGIVGLIVACGSSGDSTFGNDGGPPDSFGTDGSFQGDASPDSGDLYANDPPPPWCGPAGQPVPPAPTGTLDCPSDKNKPGCSCDKLGETAACWTGLRVNRGLGICKDGMTTCGQKDETTLGWGACVGETLPNTTATQGKDACKCFSLGQWKIDNLSPCFFAYSDPAVAPFYAVSTIPGGDGGVTTCPAISGPPEPTPTDKWSTDSLTVDCAGHFKLCYALKAGSYDAPAATDCTLAKVCVEADYLTANVEQAFPPLDPWESNDTTCATQWHDTGGYGEMTVVGKSVICDVIDDGSGGDLVFNRVKYCPSKCENGMNPGDPACQNCQAGGSGSFN